MIRGGTLHQPHVVVLYDMYILDNTNAKSKMLIWYLICHPTWGSAGYIFKNLKDSIIDNSLLQYYYRHTYLQQCCELVVAVVYNINV